MHCFELHLEIRATPERIWHQLTDPEGVRGWLAAEIVDLDPRPGGRFRVSWCEGRNDLVGRYRRFVPPRSLAMEWAAAGGRTDDRAVWRLSPLEEGLTRVTFAHDYHYDPFSRFDERPGARADWELILDHLRERCER